MLFSLYIIFKMRNLFSFLNNVSCFVKIDKVTFVAKNALVYDFYFIFNKCQNRETLIHQEQNLLHISIFESPFRANNLWSLHIFFPAIKSRASFTQYKEEKLEGGEFV